MNVRPLALILLLAACAVPVAAPVPLDAPQPGDLVGGGPADMLVEREPDLCRLTDFQRFVGQPGASLQGAALGRESRVVEFGGIVSQEYNPSRVNFFLDPAGTVVRIACG